MSAGVRTIFWAGASLALIATALFVALSGDAAPHPTSRGGQGESVNTGLASTRSVELPAESPSRSPVVPTPSESASAASKSLPGTNRITGRVLLHTHEPACGARVWIGREATTTAADGAFSIPRADLRPDDDLIAIARGEEPARTEDIDLHPDVVAGRPLEIVLSGPAASIDGLLMTPDGRACPGWKLRLHTGTDTGLNRFPPTFAEDLSAGAEDQGPGPFSGMMRPIVNPNILTTGTDGSFQLAGLSHGKEYVLRAWNESTLQTVISAPVPAGSSRFAFVVPVDVFREVVCGHVVDRFGQPLSDVRVRLSMRVFQSKNATSLHSGQEVTTAVDGAYEFRHVPRNDLLIRFDGDDVIENERELAADDLGDDMLMRLECQHRFRFVSGVGGARVDALRVLDAADEVLMMTAHSANGHTHSSQRLPLDAASGEISVSDRAAWLSLESGGRELRRIPLCLQRGGTLVIHD